MNFLKPISMVFGLVLGFFLLTSVFTVDETQRAIILRLGKIQTDSEGVIKVLNPGLQFKVPFIDSVRYFDKRIHTFEIEKARIPTKEKKDAMIDTFNKWHIVNFDKFYKTTGGQIEKARRLLLQKTEGGLRSEIGRRNLTDVVSVDREVIMEKITEDVNKAAMSLGIEVIDTRIVRVDLPNEVSDAVFGLMRTERQRIAAEHRAQGNSDAEAIRANADAQVTVILATAEQEAKSVKGDGDAKAARIYEAAYAKDPEFFRFYRSLEAYKNTFRDKGDTLVLKPDSDFFKYFHSIKGTPAKKNDAG